MALYKAYSTFGFHEPAGGQPVVRVPCNFAQVPLRLAADSLALKQSGTLILRCA